MVPNYFFGWNYGTRGLGYGTGGYMSYYVFFGVALPHSALILFMVTVGTITTFLGVYLVLRMRWGSFPERLKVKNYKVVMIATWTLWFVNIMVGFLVYYYFAYLETG